MPAVLDGQATGGATHCRGYRPEPAGAVSVQGSDAVTEGGGQREASTHPQAAVQQAGRSQPLISARKVRRHMCPGDPKTLVGQLLYLVRQRDRQILIHRSHDSGAARQKNQQSCRASTRSDRDDTPRPASRRQHCLDQCAVPVVRRAHAQRLLLSRQGRSSAEGALRAPCQGVAGHQHITLPMQRKAAVQRPCHDAAPARGWAQS